MLGSLQGTVTAHLNQRILVEVAGVGYWVHTGSWQPEGEITCYLYHHVREEASDLYGFSDLATLALFEQLLSVSGIGPKAALAILSLGSSEQVRQAIAIHDSAFLSSAPGIGEKAAQKVILELQKKVGQPVYTATGGNQEEIIQALSVLGYKPQEIYPILKDIPVEILSLDLQVKWVLQKMAKRS